MAHGMAGPETQFFVFVFLILYFVVVITASIINVNNTDAEPTLP